MDSKQERSKTVSSCSKTDYLAKIKSKGFYPRSVSENELSNCHLSNNDMLQTNQIQHYNSKNILTVPVPVIKKSRSTFFQSTIFNSKTKCSFSKSMSSFSVENESELSLPGTINVNSSIPRNSTKTSVISPMVDTSPDITCQAFSPDVQLKYIKTFADHLYEEIDEIDNQDAKSIPENNIFSINTIEYNEMSKKNDGIFYKSQETESFENQK